jgi:hypothetical protein
MATYTKYEVFSEHLTGKVHDLFGSGGTVDTVKLAIHTDAPVVATDAGLADLTQITGTGYTSGGNSVTPVGTRSGATYTFAGTDIVWTAGASDWTSTARYVTMYNDTPTSPADPLIAYWDYGATFALANGETFTADFGASIFTLA